MPDAPELVLFVLDVEQGKPVMGMQVTLSHRSGNSNFQPIFAGITEADGCLRMKWPPDLTSGWFRAEYRNNARRSNPNAPPTFPEICVDFGWDGAADLVLPLLISAHGYTVYRGS